MTNVIKFGPEENDMKKLYKDKTRMADYYLDLAYETVETLKNCYVMRLEDEREAIEYIAGMMRHAVEDRPKKLK